MCLTDNSHLPAKVDPHCFSVSIKVAILTVNKDGNWGIDLDLQCCEG